MRVRPSTMVAALGAFALSACGQSNTYVAPPPPCVTVAQPVKQAVTRYLEATGNVAAVNSADLVARVPGFVEEIKYQDGAHVKRGTLLFTIEPKPYKVKLEQAQAAEAAAATSLKVAETAYQRQVSLLATGNTTQANYDQALQTRDSAQSSFDQAHANTVLAQINYDYTQVSAPFDGIATARQVSVGQYVGGTATPTVLASIVQRDPVYVNFTVSEQDVLKLRAEIARRGVTREELRKVPVEVGLQTDSSFPHQGTLDYAAPTITQSTGTLPVRAILQNPDQVLLPGYFVRVRVPTGETPDALLIPETALNSDQGGTYVLVVGPDNVVQQRRIEAGQVVDTRRVVEKGLAADDRVVVSGMLRAIPGEKVDAQMQAAADTSGTPGGAH